ncbi:MAG: Rpp14/Pop5 family protein [Candidatus Bathyarchaeia archaeon]
MQRERWRYLLVRVVSDRRFSEEDLRSALEDVLRCFFGLTGLLQANLKILRYSPEHGEAVLKSRAGSLNIARSAVALLTQVSGEAVSAFVVRCSGTLRALRKADPGRCKLHSTWQR